MMNDAAAKTSRTYARKLFAEIAVRLVAIGADMVLVLLGVVFVVDGMFKFFGLGSQFHNAAWALLLFAYFTASWVSPLQATPMQLLLGVRVLDVSGAALALHAAAVRSAVLLAEWWLAVKIFEQLLLPDPLAKASLVGLLMFVPSVTPRRQGIHDFFARSIVVNKRAIRSPDEQERMRNFLRQSDVSIRRDSRPSLYKIIIDAIGLGIPVFVIATALGVANQKNMYARTAYALSEAQPMKLAVESWFDTTGSWPESAADLGLPLRHNYPAGGYYLLEKNGEIRIRFEVRPELRNGSILLVPQVDVAEVTWECRTEGDILPQYLPTVCRD